jgi:hypothetical protein
MTILFRIKFFFQKRIQPLGKARWDIESVIRGYRKRKYAEKFGTPINLSGKQHLHVYVTLACEHDCYYCQNKFYCEDGKYPKFKYTKADEWAYWLNRMYGFHHIDFNGGESFLHPEFIELLNLLENHNIVVFTMLPPQKLHLLDKINTKKNNITLAVSYHPLEEKRSLHEFATDFLKIPSGLKPTLQIIDVPEVSVKDNISAFVRHGIYVYGADAHTPTIHNKIDPNNLSTVSCHSDMDCIAPDLRCYRCLGIMLWDKKDVINGQHISNYHFSNDFAPCMYYAGGNCGPCTLQADIVRIK